FPAHPDPPRRRAVGTRRSGAGPGDGGAADADLRARAVLVLARTAPRDRADDDRGARDGRVDGRDQREIPRRALRPAVRDSGVALRVAGVLCDRSAAGALAM